MARITAPIRKLLRAQIPLWACEVSSSHLAVVGTDRGRSRVVGQAVRELPAGSVRPSLADTNLPDPDTLRPIFRAALDKAGFRGSEIGLVIPDEAARISVLAVEEFPKHAEEQDTLIRWKLKKAVPFDIDTAQLDYKVLSRGTGVELLVAISPRNVVREYEALLESLDLDPGFVIPSTLAAMNLIGNRAGDCLFIKRSTESVSTSILSNGRLQFYRRVSDVSVYDAVYPTLMYYQDKLGGKGITQAIFCGVKPDIRFAEIETEIGIPIRPMEPAGVDDVLKPALGAVEISWTSSN